ncbi:phage tail protein [Bordetella sp. 2513F-2]
MRKPAELRAYLTRANAFLQANPDRLSVFIDDARVRSTASGNLSHEYAYTLNLIIQDFTGEPAAIVLPILAWLRRAQPEVFANPQMRDNALQLEVELLNNQTVDVSIRLSLTERVVVGADSTPGRLQARYVGEPGEPYLTGDGGPYDVYEGDKHVTTLPDVPWDPMA